MFKPLFYTYKKCFTTLLFILFFIGLLPPNLNGQVKIKERVELNPENSTLLYNPPIGAIVLEVSIAPGRSYYEPVNAGEIVDISLFLCERISMWGCEEIIMPPSQVFNATVTWNSFPGEDEDNIPYLYYNGTESFTLENIQEGFQLKAPEYLQAYPVWATVTVSTVWNGQTVVGFDDQLIEQDTSIIISFNPSSISVGDTVELVLEKMVYGGNIIPYHPLQQFEVGMLEGCINGNILVDDSTGSYFERVTQPIYFVAADTLYTDTLETDTASVRLRVGLNQDWSDPYTDQTEVLRKKWLAKNGLEENDYPLKKTNKTNSYVESSCYTGTYISWVYDDVDAILNKLKIELMSYPPIGTKRISGTPGMPEFPISLKITNDTEGGFLRYTLLMKWKNTQQTGQPVYGAGITHLIQVNPEDLPIIDFNIDWNFYGEDVICGGDDITLKIEYNGVTKEIKLNTNILGDNPEKPLVHNYLSTILLEPILKQMKVIMFKESSVKQFWETGYVKIQYNDPPWPPDWGICQINKANPTFSEIWNWQENVNSGINHLSSLYSETDDFFSRKKKEHPNAVYFTTYELLIQTAQRYRRGWYYADWEEYNPKTGKLGHWRENSLKKFREYGDDFMERFINNNF